MPAPKHGRQTPDTNTAQQLAAAAAELRKLRTTVVGYNQDESKGANSTEGERLQAAVIAAQLRHQALEETVSDAFSLMPAAVAAVKQSLDDPKERLKAARLLFEVAQLVGPRMVNRLDAPGDAGKSIGELEADIARTRAMIEARMRAQRVVSTQLPTASDPKPEPGQ